MTIEQLKRFPQQPVQTVQLPRCDAITSAEPGHAQQWRTKRFGDPVRCSRGSVVKLDGKHYCRIHAGFAVLELYLAGKLVSKDSC